jgi:hypothetical protein
MPAEVLQFAEEPLDQVALSVERPREAGFPLAIGLRRDVGNCTLILDQAADCIGVIGLVAKHDGSWRKSIEQLMSGRRIVRMAGAQANPDRQPLRIDERVDLGRETAPGATETMILTPLFAVAACWCARMEVLSIIWMSLS